MITLIVWLSYLLSPPAPNTTCCQYIAQSIRTRHIIDNRHVMLVQNYTKTHPALYNCNTTNAQGFVAPTFMEPIQMVKYPVYQYGPTLMFLTRVNSFPGSQVQWYFNNVPIVEGGRFRVTQYFPTKRAWLTVYDATDADTGTYSAVARNDYGLATVTYKLVDIDF